jgi:hypothetical protein
MSHLSAERLAALVDDAPTSAELAHLASCSECTRERNTYLNLASLASAASAQIGVPVSSWDKLAPALVADGVLDRGRGFHFRTRMVRRPWLQAAAAVLLISGGMMAGRFTAGASVLPLGESSPVAQTVAPADTSPAHFASIDEARAAQARSQNLYQAATAYLAQNDSANSAANTPAAMRTRLAALDRVRDAMGEALNEAPYDPVINDYLLAAVGQREATIRQLNTALPAGLRLTSY